MKIVSSVRISTGLILALAGLALAIQPVTFFTISGVVVDSATGLPVQNAIVLLYDTRTLNIDTSDLSTLELDTAFTGSDGSFSKVISVPMGNLLLVYAAVKDGYSLYFNGTGLLSSPVRLDTIRLVPTTIAAKDTITVSGKVVDSATGVGIPGALVGLSGGDLDTVGKTATTGADGSFSRQVIINKVGGMTIVGYIAYKDGYTPAIGQKTANGKTLDLGTIGLSQNTPVRRTLTPAAPVRTNPTSMNVYSLNGRLVYSGPAMRADLLLKNASGALLVEFRDKGVPVGRQKMIPSRQ